MCKCASPRAVRRLTIDSDKQPKENGDSGAADTTEARKDPPPSEKGPEKPQQPENSADVPAKEPEKPADTQPASDEPTASGALIPDSSEKKEEASDSKPGQAAEQPADNPAEPVVEKPAESAPKEKPAEAAQNSAGQTNGDAVQPEARGDKVPSSILEKGIVYFFFRARVNVDDPQDINDIARSYMILRPLPKGAKLGNGPIGDEGNCRLLAIPKKVLPLSGKDRFMSFVEGAKKSFADLKGDFLSSSDYATKTSGTSHSPPATPVAEGVYAITTTGRESHFAYMITIPAQLGEVQKDVGIKEQGSFVVSAKNPKAPGPANASLGKDPGYPQEIQDEFRGLRWMPLQPKLLDYVNTQFLLIGESGGIDSALEGLPRDEKKGLSPPKDEIEKLEGEDEIRVNQLDGESTLGRSGYTDYGSR